MARVVATYVPWILDHAGRRRFLAPFLCPYDSSTGSHGNADTLVRRLASG